MNEATSFPRGHVSGDNDKLFDKSKKRYRGNDPQDAPSKFEFCKDNLFKNDRDIDPKRKRTNFPHQSELCSPTANLNPLGGGGVIHADRNKSKLPFIEFLGFSKMHEGIHVLGIVREVSDDFAAISLPNMLTGYIDRRIAGNEIDAFKRSLKLGKMMEFAVLRTITNAENQGQNNIPCKRIELSMSPKLINRGLSHAHLHNSQCLRGEVVSREDHGYLVNVAIDGVTAFLSYENIEHLEGPVDDKEIGNEIKPGLLDVNMKSLIPGIIFDFYIKSLNRFQSNTRTVIQLEMLSSSNSSRYDMEDSYSMRIKKGQIIDYDYKALHAGMKVLCDIEGYASNGLLVSFFSGTYKGSIEMNHLGALYPSKSADGTEWHEIIRKGRIKQVLARIILIDSVSKTIRLSMLPHVLAKRCADSSELPKLGAIIHNATVLRIDKGKGALLSIPREVISASPENELEGWEKESLSNEKSTESNHPIYGVDVANSIQNTHGPTLLSLPEHKKASSTKGLYVFVADALDDDKSTNDKLNKDLEFMKIFRVGELIPKVRVTSKSCLMDNIVLGAVAKQILQAQVVSFEDIVPGKIYRDVPIVKIGDFGVVVSLGMKVNAFCSFMHLYDKMPIDPQSVRLKKQYGESLALGKKITVRCLWKNTSKRLCHVTHKPSLVKDNGTVIVDYESIPTSNEVVKGFVSSIKATGITVCFYNNLRGWCAAASLQRDLGVINIQDRFSVGDVVKCCVIRVDERKGKKWLRLSLNTSLERISASIIHSENHTIPHEPGSVLPSGGKIVKLNDSELNGVYAHAVILFRVAGSEFECHLPYSHILENPLPHVNLEAQNLGKNLLLLDKTIRNRFKVGDRLESECVVLKTNPSDSAIAMICIKPKILETAKRALKEKKLDSTSEISESHHLTTEFLPASLCQLFVGCRVVGVVVVIDVRFGALVRFLNDLTGIIPKSRGGLDVSLYSTVVCVVELIDKDSANNTGKPKIVLKQIGNVNVNRRIEGHKEIGIGEFVGDVKILHVDFERAKVRLLNPRYDKRANIIARVHVSMAIAERSSHKDLSSITQGDLNSCHPFSGWKAGEVKSGFRCIAIEERGESIHVELSNAPEQSNIRFLDGDEFPNVGQKVSGIIIRVDPRYYGVRVVISPGIHGFIPALELDDDPDMLNQMDQSFLLGSRIDTVVLPQTKSMAKHYAQTSIANINDIQLSAIDYENDQIKSFRKPQTRDIVTARIALNVDVKFSPAIMLELRRRFMARCCITELEEYLNWANMPLCIEEVVPGVSPIRSNPFQDGKFVKAVVLGGKKSDAFYNVSLRKSRMSGSCSPDQLPKVGDIVKAYVTETNKKGCFLRLSQIISGRAVLKELADAFVADPQKLYLPGRLVIGKIKQIREAATAIESHCAVKPQYIVDMDLRESSLLNPVSSGLSGLVVGMKVVGVITRVESYGVFVRIDNTKVTGLAHITECSDGLQKSVTGIYNPGDKVKALILSVDLDANRLSLGLKPSYFQVDNTSGTEDDSICYSTTSFEDEGSDGSIDEINIETSRNVVNDSSTSVGLNESHNKKCNIGGAISAKWDAESQSDVIFEMDTDVGFNWETIKDTPKEAILDTECNETESESQSSNRHGTTIRKSRRKGTENRDREIDVMRKEAVVATGELETDPQNAKDFERLIATQPNASEHWIKFMAHYLSLADIDAARRVADRALDRIDFRKENEKLNVWCALLAIEIRYGTLLKLQETIDQACLKNDPKKVYLRVCHMLEEQAQEAKVSPSIHAQVVVKADHVFHKMCSKFKDKKKSWLAYFKYLFAMGRLEEVHESLKLSLKTLPSYKHTEVVSKFAQLDFEHGRSDRARTIFESLLVKMPKRLDIFFVYVDKEVKSGNIDRARNLFKRITKPPCGEPMLRLSDKQMKSVFKKWYKLEEENGNLQDKETVKRLALEYIERTSN